MEAPEPPPLGWTMHEAVTALLPDLLAAADQPPPPGWWMAGGAEYKAAERLALHRAFARIMEAGSYCASGMVKEQEQPIAPALWRAATFGLGLQGDRVNRDALLVGSKIYKGVRVNKPAIGDISSPRVAAGSGDAAKRQGPEAGIVWWTACETYTWVAFGKARPLAGNIEFPAAEWSQKWRNWPTDELSKAFVCIAMNKPWGEATWGGRGEDHCMDMARGLIKETGKSAEVLNDFLAADTEQCERNEEALAQAYRDVMAEVQAGRLTVWARRAFRHGTPDISAKHEKLDTTALFLGSRGISIFGTVNYCGPDATGFEFLDYKGPFYDEVRFDAGQVQLLRPITPADAAAPMPPIYNTGTAGRPTSKGFALTEMQRRAAANEMEDKLSTEVKVLLEWLQREHPKAPRASAKGLENGLRDDFKTLRRTPK